MDITTNEPDAKSMSLLTGDSGPGTAIKDLLPIPSDMQPITDPARKEVANTLMEDPSLSHALATEDHDDKGRAQQLHDEEEVLDLGWNEKKQDIAAPLVGGMNNEELWLLVRRFDKVLHTSPFFPIGTSVSVGF